VHPISYAQAIVLGLLQGASELFPISSLGHSVLVPRLLGWDIHSGDEAFLSFLVATHLATALVLLGFFWADWVRIVRALWPGCWSSARCPPACSAWPSSTGCATCSALRWPCPSSWP
jgi:undecaprenyl pyrophosphate phosphatase UppP